VKSFPILSATILLTAALTGCGVAGGNADTAAIKTALQDNEAQWNKDFAAKDIDKMLSHYSDDAVLMSPGMPASVGKDAIRKMLAGMNSDPALSLTFTPSKLEVSAAGDIAWTQGSYTMTMTGPDKKPMTDHGSYVTTYRKGSDGSWKAVADIATSEAPSPHS
jgi:uncharacterized protein (TIGR02246 family)